MFGKKSLFTTQAIINKTVLKNDFPIFSTFLDLKKTYYTLRSNTLGKTTHKVISLKINKTFYNDELFRVYR